jgi:hypothetical protein
MPGAIATVSKATLTALTPMVAVYFWPKGEIMSYTPKNATSPLLSLPRAPLALPVAKAF